MCERQKYSRFDFFMKSILIPSCPLLVFDLLLLINCSISTMVHGFRRIEFGFEGPVRKSLTDLLVCGILLAYICPISAKNAQKDSAIAAFNVILILLKKFFRIQLFCYPFKFVIYISILNEFNS